MSSKHRTAAVALVTAAAVFSSGCVYTADRIAVRTADAVRSTHDAVKSYPSIWTEGPQLPIYAPWPQSDDAASMIGAVIVVPPAVIISGSVSFAVWLISAVVGTLTFAVAHAVAAVGGVGAGLIEGLYLDGDRIVRVLSMEPRDYATH